jgi:hypothetical protein
MIFAQDGRKQPVESMWYNPVLTEGNQGHVQLGLWALQGVRWA